MVARFISPSLPGLTRQSSRIDRDSDLDARVKPAHEGSNVCREDAFHSLLA
jgi:hypothetical protein